MGKKYQILSRITAFILILVFTSVIIVSPLSVKVRATNDKMSSSSGNNVIVRVVNPPYHLLICQIADKYDIDYRLIYSIIKQESRFQSDAVSDHGATGLMQVMPVCSSENDTDAADIDLSVPEDNIQAGISYFASMMELFKKASPEDQIELALAAYNAGPARIYDAMEVAAYMGENPLKWLPVRNALPLLSMRYYSLHQLVWKDGKPKAGYYGEYHETVSYVESVIKYYSEYKAQFHEADLASR
ncbi:MAG: transglycosylase SLT domain-containing protein [Bacteroidota bacterium]